MAEFPYKVNCFCEHRVRRSDTLRYLWASLGAQMVKNLPAVRETQVQSLGRENPLEEAMAIHSCILAWKMPWTKEPGQLWSIGLQRVRPD